MTGRLFLPTNSYVSGNVALNFDQIKGGFVDMNNLYVTRRFNMVNHKIIIWVIQLMTKMLQIKICGGLCGCITSYSHS